MIKMNQKGFTLIELLIVVAIIAILAAIAIPQFSTYRKRGYNASANSDLRNMRTTQEAMYADFSDYGNGANAGPGQAFMLSGYDTNTAAQTVNVSPNVMANVKTLHPVNKGIAYSAGTVHALGDTEYGVGSPQTTVYRRQPSANPPTIASIDADVLTPTDLTTDVFAGSWNPIQ